MRSLFLSPEVLDGQQAGSSCATRKQQPAPSTPLQCRKPGAQCAAMTLRPTCRFTLRTSEVGLRAIFLWSPGRELSVRQRAQVVAQRFERGLGHRFREVEPEPHRSLAEPPTHHHLPLRNMVALGQMLPKASLGCLEVFSAVAPGSENENCVCIRSLKI